MISRVVYMGTPDFATPALEMIARFPEVEIALVVTQPDRPAGRGRRLLAPPVKQMAERLGLPIYQTSSLRTAAQRQPIVNARPDLIVVTAFGLILRKSILELPRLGCVNLHASLLPKYRGASPIAAAILSGDTETGVTLMHMERGLDTGPMYSQASIDITPEDTTESSTGRLAIVARELLQSNLGDLLADTLTEVSQPAEATITRPLVKADGWIDWTKSAVTIERHIRAMWSWPRAWTTIPDGSTFQIQRAHVAGPIESAIPGAVVGDHSGLRISCTDRWIEIEVGQLAGGKPLSGRQLASHALFGSHGILGQAEPPHVPGPLICPVVMPS